MDDLNERLRQIMAEHNLKRREAAGILGVPPRTLDGWLAPEDSPSHRPIKHEAFIVALESQLRDNRLNEKIQRLRQALELARRLIVASNLDAPEHIQVIDEALKDDSHLN